MSLSCDALLGHELMVSHATCRGCDQGTGVGVLPQTCGLFYSGVGSGGKGNWSDRERLIALLMLFTLGVLFFLLMRELRRGPKVTCENQSMRGSVNREKIKMQTRKPKLNETIRKPEQKSEAEIRSAKEDCLSYICIVSKYKDYTFDYDDMAGYLHYIQLQISIGPSEGSWRSKETYFQNQRTLIHRIFSVKTNYQTRFQKSGICIFILCALSATRNCVFSCQKEKKKMISMI